MKRNRIVQFLRSSRRRHGYKSQYSFDSNKPVKSSEKSSTLILNTILIIANIAIAGGTMYMAYENNAQVTMMRAQQISDRIKDSAVASDIHLEDRAYVSVAGSSINFMQGTVHGKEGIHTVGETVVTFENIGRTPAYNLQDVSSAFCVVNYPYPDTPTFDGIKIDTCSKTNLYPFGNFELTPFYFEFDGKNKESLLKGERSIYVFANLIYEDVFHVHHHTHLCYKYSFESRGFIPYGKYNYSD